EVVSMLIAGTVAGALVLPAWSVQTPGAGWFAPSELRTIGAVHVSVRDRLSVPVNVTVTAVLCQPKAFAGADGVPIAFGGVLSIFTVNDADAVSPAPL